MKGTRQKAAKNQWAIIFFDNAYHLRKLSLSKSLINGLNETLFNQEFSEGKKVLEDHGYISSFRHQFDDFYQCVKTPGRQPVASAEFSLGEMKTAFAMERSDREGRWIEIE